MVESRRQVLGENHQPILPQGTRHARVMFIGIAPGRAAINIPNSETEKPFAYASGDLLREMIQKAGFKEEDVYITNCVKCNTPSDNIFLEEDISKCIGLWLNQEILLVDPKVIVLLGKKAQEWFYMYASDKSKARVVLSTFHPAYVQRNMSMENMYLTFFIKVYKEMTG